MPKKKTHEKFIKEVEEKMPWIKVLGVYMHSETAIEVKDTRCGHSWKVKPNSLLHGTGCPFCGRKKSNLNLVGKVKLHLTEVKKRVELVSNYTIEYIDGYVNTQLKCKWRCKNCNEIWEATPNHLFNGKGCPKCAIKSLELPIKNLLDKKNVKYIHNKGLIGCNFNNSIYPLRPDFLIQNNYGKLVIETDGQQHFIPIYGEEALKFQKEKDEYKNKYFKEHGFIVIRITSSPTKKWGTKNHLTLNKGLQILDNNISNNGIINFNALRIYDFNKT